MQLTSWFHDCRVDRITMCLPALAALVLACASDPAPPAEPEFDGIAPAAVRDLSAEPTGPFSAMLRWTATGDDDSVGVATRYAIRYLPGETFPEALWEGAAALTATPEPAPPGSLQTAVISGLQADTAYVFALRVFDESGNASELSNRATMHTPIDQNTGWAQGASAAPAPDGPVRAMRVSGGALYAGGEFQRIGKVQAGRIARYDGTTWSAVGNSGFAGSSGSGTGAVLALAEFRGALVAAGNFSQADGAPASAVAWFDGVAWRSLGTGIGGVVRSLAVYQNDLYAGGIFTRAGEFPARHLARWDGVRWLPVEGISQNGAQVYDLQVFGGVLVVGGTFTRAGSLTVNHVAAWNGSAWSELAGGMAPEFLASVNTLGVYGASLVASGRFGFAGGIQANQIALWSGGTWAALGNGFNILDLQVAADMVEFGGELYVTGGMSLAAGPDVHGITRWDGERWATLGDGLDGGGGLFGSAGSALAVFRRQLWVAGDFQHAGGRVAPYLARWNGLP